MKVISILFALINLPNYILTIYPSIYLSIFLSRFISFYLSIFLSIHHSIYTAFYLSIYLSINLSIYPPFIHPSLFLLSFFFLTFLAFFLYFFLALSFLSYQILKFVKSILFENYSYNCSCPCNLYTVSWMVKINSLCIKDNMIYKDGMGRGSAYFLRPLQ